MAEGHLIYRRCKWCDGTGQRQITTGSDPVVIIEGDCPYCATTGTIFWGWMTKDNFEIPDNLPDP